MWSTPLVTHKYQSIVLVQRLNTRDELGFERRWCCWRCWWRLPSPRWESCWWWWWRWFPPFGREVPPAESLRRRAKVLLPKFRLETAALRPESPPLIFSRSKWLIYQKRGTKGGLGWAKPTRAHPGVLWSPSAPPPVVIYSSISYIFHKKSPQSFSSFEVVYNR